MRQFKRQQQKNRYKKFLKEWESQYHELLLKKQFNQMTSEEATLLKAFERSGKPTFAVFNKQVEVKRKEAELPKHYRNIEIEEISDDESWEDLVT